ncbi:uncharacterized protein LOC142165155 [Nicotiana tabacum]|uniref:Uncharacterized protein LOC142165155 n=1 Tax=Nicotiana tabacum TaxID=4097 RepID=A0AC58S4H0_TOBAC
MRRQNRSDSVKVLESRKDIVGQSEKKKSKRVIMDVDQGKRKRVVEDEVNLGVNPKTNKVQKAEKVKIPDKVCKPWKLYIPVGEPFPVTHWSSYTNVDIVSVLQSKLTDVQLRMFRKSCFGYFLNLPRVSIQTQLIRSLMFRDGPNRLVDTYFSGFEVVSKKSLIYCFEKKKWQSDEDAVKIAIIYFINTFLVSTQAQKTFISKRDFHLVESGEYVSFPWGKIAFRALMKSVRDRLRGKSEFYRIDGFLLALQVWFYECFTVVEQKFDFKNISPTIEELRRFTLHVEVFDEYQKYLTSRNREKHPIDDSDDFVTPSPKYIKEPVPPKKLHKQLNSFMKYVSDKFKELFELINSKLGASEVKYGAHPEEDTIQDNNDFVSNMEFGSNEDVEMDGCQVGGSEGKDVPHSQRDTSVADQLGVNNMEGPSSVKVDMFVAKVTFTPDVAHVGVNGEIADAVARETDVDAAAGETEEESEKQKVPESRTGVVCATASVDEAAGEMVLYNPELLPEVSPQMEKRKRCPAKALQSPFITMFDSGSSTGVVVAKGKKQIYAIKHPFQSKIGTSVNSSLLNVFVVWIKEGKNEIYPNHVSELNPAYDLGVFHVEDKKWFYTLAYNGQPLDDSHIDVLFYYLRKKGKYDKDLPVTFTTTDWYFDEEINDLWQVFIDTDGDNDVCTPKHVIAEYIQGFVLDVNVPWHTVEHVLMPINVAEQ